MSLILDALRKSERTRQQTLSGRISASGSPFDRGHMPVPWAALIGLLLIANAIVLGVIYWRSHAAGPVPLAAASTPVNVRAVVKRAAIYRPAVRPLAEEAAAVTQVKPPLTAASTDTGTSSSRLGQPASGTTSHAAPAVVTATTVKSAASAVVSSKDDVPLLTTLPLAFQQSLPALHLDVHSYSADPANRFVVINMQRYEKGDTLTEGPTVIAIVPGGVILEYHDQKFLLPRH